MLMFLEIFSWCLVKILKMKCDQDLCLNLCYDLKKLLWQDQHNPRVRCAFGNVLEDQRYICIWLPKLNITLRLHPNINMNGSKNGGRVENALKFYNWKYQGRSSTSETMQKCINYINWGFCSERCLSRRRTRLAAAGDTGICWWRDYKVDADNKEMKVTNSDNKQQLFICIIAWHRLH